MRDIGVYGLGFGVEGLGFPGFYRVFQGSAELSGFRGFAGLCRVLRLLGLQDVECFKFGGFLCGVVGLYGVLYGLYKVSRRFFSGFEGFSRVLYCRVL